MRSTENNSKESKPHIVLDRSKVLKERKSEWRRIMKAFKSCESDLLVGLLLAHSSPSQMIHLIAYFALFDPKGSSDEGSLRTLRLTRCRYSWLW